MNRYSPVIVAASPANIAQWAWSLGSLAIVVASILAMFEYEVVNAVVVWWYYPAYSHCFLVIPISAWLIWEKRHDLAQMTPSLAPRALMAIPVLMLLWFIGEVGTVNELRQFVLVALINAAAVVMLGWRIFRVILFPALYLFFLVPFGQYFIPPLQQFATSFTDLGLSLLGIPHYTEGTIIELAGGRFEIAEACAGLRFLIATLALGVLFAHLAYRRWWKIGTFLIACVIIPVIANGLRCLGIIALAHYTNNAAAVEADHILYGWGFNVAILLVMFIAGIRFRDAADAAERVLPADSGMVPYFALFTSAVATILAVASGPAFSYWQDHRPVGANAATLAFPRSHLGWTVVPTAGSWRPIYAAPDQELEISLAPEANNMPPVDVAILFYTRVRAEHSLISSTNQLWDSGVWNSVENHAVDARLGTIPVKFSESIIASALERRIVWSSYWMDGQFTTSGVRTKLLQLMSVVSGHPGAALVAFSTPIDGAPEDARARLASALAALNDLPKQLDAANGSGSERDPLD